MSVISTILGPAAFELIRQRIAEIIADELLNQATIGYDDDLVANVYVERFMKLHPSEMPAVNITSARTQMDSHDFTKMDGVSTFFIDCLVIAKNTTDEDGEAKAQRKMQKLAGVIAYILQHSKYVALGFEPPFIQYRRVMDIKFGDPERTEQWSFSKGRIVLEVSAPEFAGVSLPRVMDGFRTQVKLHDTEKGYLYFGPYSTTGIRIFDDSFDPNFE